MALAGLKCSRSVSQVAELPCLGGHRLSAGWLGQLLPPSAQGGNGLPVWHWHHHRDHQKLPSWTNSSARRWLNCVTHPFQRAARFCAVAHPMHYWDNFRKKFFSSVAERGYLCLSELTMALPSVCLE